MKRNRHPKTAHLTISAVSVSRREKKDDELAYMKRMLIEVRRDGTKVYKAGPAIGYGWDNDMDLQ